MTNQKVALVLQGGGAKGAFQAGAEAWLRHELDIEWDVIAGVSVGALNAAMLATGKGLELSHLWGSIEEKDVFVRRSWWRTALDLITRKRRSLWDNSPLLRVIEENVDFHQLQVPLLFGVTDLVSGGYASYEWLPGKPVNATRAQRLLLASTTIPLLWEPVGVEGHGQLVDGGVRTGTPLGDVLKHDPDVVVIILCTPLDQMSRSAPPKDLFQVGSRSLELLMDEVFQDDIKTYLRINDLVAQAEEQGMTLRKPNGQPYKSFRTIIVQPLCGIGGPLDFDDLHAKYALGGAAAEHAWFDHIAGISSGKSTSPDSCT